MTNNTTKLVALIGIVARVQREMHEALAADRRYGHYTPGGVVTYAQLQAWETSITIALREQAETGDEADLSHAYVTADDRCAICAMPSSDPIHQQAEAP